MTALGRVIVAFAVAVPLQSALPIDRPAACQLNESNRRWVQRALDGWDRIGRNDLRLSPSALPWIVLYDDACAWHLAFDDALLADSEPGGAALLFAAEPVRVRSRRHAE